MHSSSSESSLFSPKPSRSSSSVDCSLRRVPAGQKWESNGVQSFWMCVCIYIHIYTHTCVYIYACVYSNAFLCIDMYISICLSIICTYVCMYLCVYLFVCLFIYVFVCGWGASGRRARRSAMNVESSAIPSKHVCTNILSIYAYEYIYIYVYTYMYIHTYMHVCTCSYIYIYICTCLFMMYHVHYPCLKGRTNPWIISASGAMPQCPGSVEVARYQLRYLT